MAMLSVYNMPHLYAVGIKADKFILHFMIITMVQTLCVIVYRMQMFHTYHLINNHKLSNRTAILLPPNIQNKPSSTKRRAEVEPTTKNINKFEFKML